MTPSPLSRREQEVLTHIIAGEKARETAAALGISTRTVENHNMAIRKKFGARNVADVVRIALRGGLNNISNSENHNAE